MKTIDAQSVRLTFPTRLNLTAANRVFIVEPLWNPSVENQAVARAQRLGQGQSVLVTRYLVKRTIEQVYFMSSHVFSNLVN
jgi:SNF2 family DNA or RNA helicase